MASLEVLDRQETKGRFRFWTARRRRPRRQSPSDPAAFFSASLMRPCHPSPVALKCARGPIGVSCHFRWAVDSRTCAPHDGTERAPRTAVIPRESGGSSTPRCIDFIAGASGILDHPLSRMMTGEVAEALFAPPPSNMFVAFPHPNPPRPCEAKLRWAGEGAQRRKRRHGQICPHPPRPPVSPTPKPCYPAAPSSGFLP